MSAIADDNTRPDRDALLKDIAKYVCEYQADGEEANLTAYHCLLDSVACGLMALDFPECVKLLGPVVEGADMPGRGGRVFGTSHELEPVQAAFNTGALVRWLDFNDTWLAAEWGHPSDNLGAILPLADYLARSRGVEMTVGDVLKAMIKAHEVQGVLALENSFNRVGLDHVLLVRVASTAVVAQMLGLSEDQVADAVSHAWVDGGALRTYRHAPNTGSRKSWAAGDATSRAVRLALMVERGEMGYPGALTASGWGFQDVLFKGQEVNLARPLESYVMENILFKISFPAEFHAQTAVECAIQLHDQVAGRLDEVESVILHTQESGVRIISKDGPLHNPADRDHCLQYMVAIGLIFGELEASHYEDKVAADPRIDALREKMEVYEDERYSVDYMDADKRSIANAIQVKFKDGTTTDKVEVEYPIGHRRRRDEGIPVLLAKFDRAVKAHYSEEQAAKILEMCGDFEQLKNVPVTEFLAQLSVAK